MTLNAASEVGKLRRVLVHRPGLEHTRLTPANAADLLFDDVIWVKQAKQEHDAFVETMRERGVEVFYAEELLTDVLGDPRGPRLDRRPGAEREARRPEARPFPPRVGASALRPAEVADYLIGGMTKEDLEGGAGLKYDASVSGDLLVPPLPNFIFQRDPSSWIFNGVTLNPMAKPARRPETAFMEAIYRHHPIFAGEDFKIWYGGVETDWGPATVEGGDVMPLGKGVAMIGMGERTSPQAVSMIARELFKAGSATLVLAVMLPRSRSYMHLDTVLTMIDLRRRDPVPRRRRRRPGLDHPSGRRSGDPGDRGVRRRGRRGDGVGARDRLASASSRPAAIRSRRAASNGTTATTSSASSPASSSPTSATSTRTPACARRASR